MTKEETEDLIKKIKLLEPLNNKDCPEWEAVEGEQNEHTD